MCSVTQRLSLITLLLEILGCVLSVMGTVQISEESVYKVENCSLYLLEKVKILSWVLSMYRSLMIS